MQKFLTDSIFEKAEEAALYIRSQIQEKASLGIVLGSGLGSFVDYLENPIKIPYASIPHFPLSTVEGHSGELIFGKLNGTAIWAMSGRFHYYEGYGLHETVFPLRVMKILEVEQLVISNAAGGLNPEFIPGDLMLIEDFIDLFPDNPLRGANISEFGPRFPDMSEPLDHGLIQKAKASAKHLAIPIKTGVYVGIQGPKLETKAEIRYCQVLGGDAIGMSTVPEIIVANQMGIKVLAISVITNQCVPSISSQFSHDAVVSVAERAGEKLAKIIENVFS
ncbi:hypothetical protein P872_06535 [Rhodonellum psychrophilum GCM71 = DSM 17998]|uniref:Purine nucleoside phosphorylase n=2 Tax=Rhodonellum TaxID=336827 RepID=U5BYL3_9BACT|nr:MULTISPECIES: purine-nucleoside phosphorylase [Rhodonellum]ERM82664.1 hypothetical protein P872_06535 [Rhodonellum psychrophilum GCM71 = DSM 17998]MDO9553554.1 purine-nucleoside phosphorylase [Rhodonellum sp.]SDZ45561.1 purine-nucleoside phosphorylase [Rhodonellum ikkaensis]